MKKTLKWLAVVIAVIMVMSVGLIGCAKPETPGTSGPPDAADPQPQETESAAAPESTEDGAGDILVYAIDQDIDNFDPFNNQQLSYAKTIGYNMFEPLLKMDTEGGYEPVLATSWEQTSPTEYVFKIRQGVTFHNGETLTPEDVKFTLEYTQDDAVTTFFKAVFAVVKSAEVVDGETLKVTLNQVSNSFLDDLCTLKIIKKGTEAANTIAPVGTGPFKFVSWAPNDKTKLAAYDGYWGDKPKLAGVDLKVIVDKTIALTNLQSGDVDFVDNLSYSQVSGIQSDANLQILVPEESNLVYIMEVGLNNVPEFANPDVMEAIYLALDRQTIADTAFYGMAVPLGSLYPNAAKFKDPSITAEYNLEKAKELIDGAGASGMEFDLVVLNGSAELEQIAVIYQASLSQIGVKMNIVKCEVAEWLDYYLNRTYDMVINYYSMGGLDPAIMNNIILKDLTSFVMPKDTKLPELITQGAAETDETVRADIYKQIQQYVRDTKIVIPIVQADLLYGASAKVKDIGINMVGHTFLNGAYIEE